MTTTLTITSGQTSFTAQNYVILPSPGTAVPDSVAPLILAAAQYAGVVLSSSAGTGVITVPSRRFNRSGVGPPVAGEGFWLLGDEVVDSNDDEWENTAPGNPGTWKAAQSSTFVPIGNRDLARLESLPPFAAKLDLTRLTPATNAPDYLHSITTYVGGTSSLVEPSIYFNGAGWGSDSNGKGWRYWMAAGPYEGSNSANENPSIWVSDDGQTWQVPPGGTNPVVAAPGVGNNCDPQLFEVAGTLYLLWAYENLPSPDVVYYQTSTDGTHWSSRTQLIAGVVTTDHEYASPKVGFDGQNWHLWALNLVGGTPYVITHRTARTLAGLSSATPANVTGLTPGNGDTQLWEFEVKRVGGEWWMLLNTRSSHGNLYMATSQDGAAWSQSASLMTRGVVITGTGSAAWDNGLVYKSTFVPLFDGQSFKIGVWYSAQSGSTGEWHVGYTTISQAAKAAPAYGASTVDPLTDYLVRVLAACKGLAPYQVGDSFNRAASASSLGSADSGQAWTANAGTWGITAAGQAYAPIAGNSKAIQSTTITDGHLSAILGWSGGSDQAWLLFRWQDTSNYMRAGMSTGGGLRLQSIVAGVSTDLISTGRAISSGDLVSISFVGSALTLSVNGAVAATATSSQFATSTTVGLQTATATVTFDNFTARSAYNGG